MRNEIQAMSLQKIKQMMKIRLISLLFTGLFLFLMVAVAFVKPWLHWSWFELVLAIVFFAILACASSVGYLFLRNKLASGGL
jgi:hypothetical protein